MKITQTQIQASYSIGRKVFDNLITKNEAIEELVQDHGMNYGSARMIVNQIFINLMDGNGFTRTLSVASFDYFLERILVDYGTGRLSVALSALNKHIEYSRGKGDPKIEMRRVYQKYVDQISTKTILNENEIQQQEIISLVLQNQTKEEIIVDLNNLRENDSETITVNRKVYKRDNKTIAQIKFLRDFKCQICGTYILKKDGTRYIEAAHIISKHKKGREVPGNILLLCPNHHKEFDWGDTIVKPQSGNQVEFKMNGTDYTISTNYVIE